LEHAAHGSVLHDARPLGGLPILQCEKRSAWRCQIDSLRRSGN
jgi:hypothetical protein